MSQDSLTADDIINGRNPHAFAVHLRCANCLKDTMRLVDASTEAEPPANIEDFLECGLLRRMVVVCSVCECPSAQLTGVDHAHGSWDADSDDWGA
ncbi:hypothetical protein Mnod_6980 [Methylobacterium nodulans ORS 2060]|uniref:Uncharacterized protein n=1 Tax=Methylobacterium nodulans (strain LMG 21967 / CNCM I-2342 / ORS 2060) TaxID=460265 RepID=B8IHQ9_METNO|nr:hypothetical protein Mnod_6980 [Methylobacterium nodulans ORS 2060]